MSTDDIAELKIRLYLIDHAIRRTKEDILYRQKRGHQRDASNLNRKFSHLKNDRDYVINTIHQMRGWPELGYNEEMHKARREHAKMYAT